MILNPRFISALACVFALNTLSACGDNNDKPPGPGPSKNKDMGGNNKMDMPADMPEADMDKDMAAVTNAISVEDQTLTDSLKVTIPSVTADVAGFVVIHEDNNGAPGPVIGVTKVNAGTSSDVIVELDRLALDQETFHAMLHKDDPADGQYTFDGANGEDGPALDAQGQVVVKPFKVTVTSMTFIPTVSVEDQTLVSPNEVLVRRAVSNGPGWIVIHEDNNGAIGGVIGQTLLINGPNLNVKVALSRDASNGERFYAMLHTDSPADGQYTFDGANGEDGPVTDEQGEVIAPDFNVTIQSMGFTPVVEVDAMQTTMDPLNVVIKRVVSDGPGWIVIHEDNNGSIGGVIGKGFVGNGETLNVNATLNREAVDGETLYAMLHTDSPADGRYTFDGANGEDGPVLKNNAPIAPPFVISLDVPIVNTLSSPSVFDLNDPRAITIPGATINGPGWIVVHETDAMGNMGGSIGETLLQSGSNQGIVVNLTRDLVDSETIIVMLHQDDPADGQYTFATNPQTDVPALDAQGQVLQQPAIVVAPQNELQVSSQDLSVFTTQVVISRVSLDQNGWIVIRERIPDPNDATMFIPGPVVGSKEIAAGDYLDEIVTLNRPAGDGETFTVQIRYDNPTDGVLDITGMNDPVATNSSGNPLDDFLSVFFIAPEAVAVRFTMVNQGASAYRVTKVEPAAFAASVSALNADNPTFNLKAGWRYGFVNNANPGHPIEFTNAGASRAADTLLLSQSAMGALQADMDVRWATDMNTVAFTVTPAFTGGNALTGYRCAVPAHASMRGGIVVTP